MVVMRNNPKISVVLPTYNGEEWLPQAIESVLNQSYKNLELIIVDDNSIKKTADIIERYRVSDSRIRVITHNTNKKLPVSLNDGFSIAEGEYFTWTSDDNWYEQSALEELLNYLLKNPSTDMVISDLCRYFDNEFLEYFETSSSPQDLSNLNSIGACFLYTREIATKVGFYNPSKFLVEDYDYWLRILLNGRIDHISKSLYNYRFHKDSLTSKRQNDVKYADIILKSEYLPMLKQKYANTSFKKMEHYVHYLTAISNVYALLHEKSVREIYIYGAGFICFLLLKELASKPSGIKVCGIYDSSADDNGYDQYGFKISLFSNSPPPSDSVIVVCSDKYSSEIVDCIRSYEISNHYKYQIIVPDFLI